ncbi:MAG: TRM11 family SAM-dependent methyltransferase [Candidatus Bathyarchaeia archaeon]|jgi:tRNA G10  N-methylase Trm11
MSCVDENLYCFVCGKNWKLSLAELAAFLQTRNQKFEVHEVSRAFFTIKTEAPLNPALIDDLGGILKIAKVAAFVRTQQLADAFVKEDKQAKLDLKSSLPLHVLAANMPSASSGKTLFGVSVYWAETPFSFNRVAHAIHRFLGGSLKDELKVQGKNARFMGFPKSRGHPQLTAVEVLKKGLVEDKAEVLLCIGKHKTATGATVAVHNPFEFQKRDVEKPVQRKIFAVPPRIAKIIVNLSRCTTGKVFLDPFCGVGTILQEALLAGAKVIGIDLNRWCVDAARRNLTWIEREYSLDDANFTVLQGDARRLTSKLREPIDCIATEPDLGPALRQVPTEAYATKLVSNLKPLFSDFLSEAHAVLREGGFLVVVAPFVKTRSGKAVTMDLQDMAIQEGFQVVKPLQTVAFTEDSSAAPSLKEMSTFVDVEEHHKIGRQIHIFQKLKF